MKHQTPLYNQHINLGAKLFDFGSWMMPIQYSGILNEHQHTRHAVTLIDTCHMGQLSVSGNDAKATLQRLIPRNMDEFKPNRCYYAFMCRDDGTFIDDIIVYTKALDHFWLVVNSETTPQDMAWIESHCIGDTVVLNESADTAKLDLQGPLSFRVLDEVFGWGNALSELTFYRFTTVSYQQIDVLISRTGYTGELGYELYMPAQQASLFWDILLKHEDCLPCGLGARDTLRLEMG